MATENAEINPQDYQQYGTFDTTARKFCTTPVEELPVYTTRLFIHEEDPLPCCNIGVGWLLFAIGFLSILPWFVGAIVFACFPHDWRERPGLAACTVAAFVTVVVGGSQLL